MRYSKEQIMLNFSYMAYYGFGLVGSDQENGLAISKDIQRALKTWKVVKNQWDLVWGPCVSAFIGSRHDDNMMFVVRNREDPAQYVIAIRGTNPVSLQDWLFEDFNVLPMVKWPYGEDKGRGKISKATETGLKCLHAMRAPADVPGEGKSLFEFIRDELEDKPQASICVTGHSLGGALAPTLALWLKDIQAEQLSTQAHISTVAFAGPSAGNKDFAQYSDQRFGADCIRVANSLDVVPYAWSTKSLLKLYTLYTPHWLLPGPVLAAGFSAMIAISLPGRYHQINADTPSLQGNFRSLLHNYFTQALYQHVVGYPEIMGLLKNGEIPLNDLFLGQLEF